MEFIAVDELRHSEAHHSLPALGRVHDHYHGHAVTTCEGGFALEPMRADTEALEAVFGVERGAEIARALDAHWPDRFDGDCPIVVAVLA